MKSLLKLTIYLSLISGIFILHMAIVGALFHPLNHINIIFLFLILAGMISSNKKILWLAAPLFFLLEIFSSFQFGINSISIYFGLLCSDWLLSHILTNRSVTTAFLSCLIGLSVYRISLFLLIKILQIFNHDALPNNMLAMLTDYAVEILMTSAISAVVYFICVVLIKKAGPKYCRGFMDKQIYV